MTTRDRFKGKMTTASAMAVNRAKGLAINGNATKTEIKKISRPMVFVASDYQKYLMTRESIRHLTRVVIPSRTTLGVILGSSRSEIKNGTRNKSVTTERRHQERRVESVLSKKRRDEEETPGACSDNRCSVIPLVRSSGERRTGNRGRESIVPVRRKFEGRER